MATEQVRLPNSGVHAEYDTGAIRDSKIGNGLPSLIPPYALRAAAKRFEDGAEHYGRNNWQRESLSADTLTAYIVTSGSGWKMSKMKTTVVLSYGTSCVCFRLRSGLKTVNCRPTSMTCSLTYPLYEYDK